MHKNKTYTNFAQILFFPNQFSSVGNMIISGNEINDFENGSYGANDVNKDNDNLNIK